jgi:hypothetical protein
MQPPPPSSSRTYPDGTAQVLKVLDMFAASFNVGWLNENGEAGHGDRMQPMRRPDNVGNGDQTTRWRPRLPRNPLASRILPDMQAERADRKPRHQATGDRDQWPAAPRPQRIFVDVATRHACAVRWCRMGVARYSRPVPADTASTTVPLRQASLAWPGTEETCPKCHGQRHVYYLHAGQPGVEVVGGKRVACPVCAGEGSVRTPLCSTTDPAG